MTKNKILKSPRFLIPAIHFLLSFFYEHFVFQFSLKDDVVAAIPMNQVISDTAERVLAYCITKVIAGIMIFALWKIVFYIYDNFAKERVIKVLTAVFVIGLFFVLAIWPEPSFGVNFDNYITFSYAIRFEPEYWHSAYSSYVFGACMMVVPHPVSIVLIQWASLTAAIGYLMMRIQISPVLKGCGKWWIFWIFLLPGSFSLMTDSYRTELYAIVCMFALALFIMDAVDRKKRTALQIAMIGVLCAFLAVWRTEGIILGLLSYLVLLLFVYRPGLKQTVIFICVFTIGFAAVLTPQKLGDAKYYGKDYSFINSFTILMNILNHQGSDLDYPGVEEDLEAIGVVAPIELIKAHGLEGYRRYNVANGHKDINQSLADKEVGKAYNKAFYRLILHNPKVYLRTQTFMLLYVMGLEPYYYIELSDKVPENNLPMWEYDAWDIGKADLLRYPGVRAWSENRIHKAIHDSVMEAKGNIESFLHRIHADSILLLGMFAVMGCAVVCEGIRFLRKKENYIALAGFAVILFGQIAAIWLVMPAASLVYLHASFFGSAILTHTIVSLCITRRIKKQD